MIKNTDKLHAATALSLGKCRGLLHSVLMGEIDLIEIQKILDITSTDHIIKSLNLEETSIDWNDYLSKKPKVIH